MCRGKKATLQQERYLSVSNKQTDTARPKITLWSLLSPDGLIGVDVVLRETEQFLGFCYLKDGPNENKDVVNKHTKTETCSSLRYSNLSQPFHRTVQWEHQPSRHSSASEEKAGLRDVFLQIAAKGTEPSEHKTQSS